MSIHVASDERSRQIGVCSGMVHALVKLKVEIGQRTYRPIPVHHKRRRREQEMQVAPLRDMYARIEQDLRRLQEHLAEEDNAP